MKKQSIIILFVFVSFITLMTFVSTSYACNCDASKSLNDYVNESNSIFSGKVTNIEEKDGQKVVVFKVFSIWKGKVQQKLEINTASQITACGYSFEKGKDYIVFASGIEYLNTGACEPNTELSDDNANNILNALGEGRQVETNERSMSFNIIVLVIILMTALVFLIKRQMKAIK